MARVAGAEPYPGRVVGKQEKEKRKLVFPKKKGSRKPVS